MNTPSEQPLAMAAPALSQSADVPILHHFEISPFSEKVRAVFGLKRLAWRSVLVPLALPKPDVIALTGGYRKTPTLQLGADVYCDTALIAQVVDELQPEPALLPAGAAMAGAVAAWADGTLFWQAVMITQAREARATLFRGMTPQAIEALRADRAAFAAGAIRPAPADAQAQFRGSLQQFERALSAQPWLLGPQPSIADFAVYHCLWFTARAGVLEPLLDAHPALQGWYERIAALGHGRREEIDSARALALAASATQHAAVSVQAGLGLAAGDAVTVAPTDYGTDPTTGTLVGLTIDRVTLERRDPRAGLVHVHFPRNGYRVGKAA